MCSKVVRDWLAEYKSLPEAELTTYASTVRNNDELILSLYELFDEELANEVIEPVCHQLFEFYRSPRIELHRFCLDFLPALIQTYLIRVSRKEHKKCSSIEAFLLALYNLEIVNADGSPKVKSFTVPSLASGSIYHEPSQVATLALTESVLKHYSHSEPVVLNNGPYPQIEMVNAQNRMGILSLLLTCYKSDIGHLAAHSHQCLCKLASRLGRTGFDNIDVKHNGDPAYLNDSMSSTSSTYSPCHRGVHFRHEPRLTVNASFLIELLDLIYFIMFNGQAAAGMAAIDHIHQRASYELYTDVLLVTNAIRNSLRQNPSGQPQDGPIGIAVAISPIPVEPVFSKSAITNASFRTKKLPEDIEVPNGEEDDIVAPPPTYDELVESEKSEKHDKAKQEADKIRSGTKITKPIKSIMKKAVGRRESDAKRRESETEARKRESVASCSPGHAGIGVNGDMTDPNMVTVSVLRESSHSIVDQFELTANKRDSYHSYHSDIDQASIDTGSISFSKGVLQDTNSIQSDGPLESVDTKL